MTDDSRILMVGSNRVKLELFLRQLGWDTRNTLNMDSTEELSNIAKGEQDIGFCIIDLSCRDEHLWECCEEMRRANIAFIGISS